MARIKKKGTTGNAKNFITRSQAVKKLQVTLADFRRLCIFKGIFPREPRNKKKANKGSTASVTFYYTKDIQYLMHEPVLQKFREHKSFAKKLNKALGRGEVSDAKKLEENRPKYKLDNIIKERYPTFIDALRDIDDPLNMLFLFSIMPVTDKISSKVTKQAHDLCNQWLAYVSRERALRKVFVSIKGVYYEAVIKGVEIRWLVPFKFPQNIPTDVDFRIMLTFLEFYSTLLNFVLFKLYTDAGLNYPPRLDFKKIKGVGGLTAFILESNDKKSILAGENGEDQVVVDGSNIQGKEISKEFLKAAAKADKTGAKDKEDEEENVEEVELDEFEDNNKNSGDVLVQPSKFDNEVANLFENFVFFIGREVPIDVLEFIILSSGGRVISELTIDELKINGEDLSSLQLDKITHQIVDRPKVANKVQGRTYVQPQWVFDSINKKQLLPVNDYLPGETLPPHLSPWGDAIGYNPEETLAQGDAEEEEESEEEEEEIEDEAEEEEEEEDEDVKAQKELELEAKGVKYSELTKNDKKRKSSKQSGKTEAEEEAELKLIMMSNKQRKLYKKMKYSNEQKENSQDLLREKRRKIEKTKGKLEKLQSKDSK